jgi:hypothetical protein
VSAPLQRIAVGVIVERRKAASQWIDFVWRPAAVLAGAPEAKPWTLLNNSQDDAASFYAGPAEVTLYRSETSNYRDNLATGTPSLWVTLRPTGAEPPFEIVRVTADPSEGEAFTETGNDLVDAVPMPEVIRDLVAEFVAEHHVERQFYKRKRDRADPEALGRRGPQREDGDE